jgi:hypothetical protein
MSSSLSKKKRTKEGERQRGKKKGGIKEMKYNIKLNDISKILYPT